MAAAIPAGVIYALIVFLIGFIFGAVRTLLLIPHLGETLSVSVEAPFMLAASWFVCRWCVERLHVSRRAGARTAMGVVEFFVLMLAELGLSVLAFDRSVAQFSAAYGTLPGMIGLAAQIVFAAFPITHVWKRED